MAVDVKAAMKNLSEATAYRARVGAELNLHSPLHAIETYETALDAESALRADLSKAIEVEKARRAYAARFAGLIQPTEQIVIASDSKAKGAAS